MHQVFEPAIVLVMQLIFKDVKIKTINYGQQRKGC